MSQIRRASKISVFIGLSIVIFFLVDFFDIGNLRPDLISNLSNLVIVLYTALITILSSILGIHLSRQYGLVSTDIVIEKSKGIFATYSIAIFISILSMMLDFKTLQDLSLEIAAVSISADSIILGAEIITVMFSAYFFPKYLVEIFRISPAEMMETLEYPDEIVKLVKKGNLHQTNTKLSRGLSLIRICIMDLSMRDDLEAVVSRFSKAIEEIPWHQKREELREKEKIDMESLFRNIHWRMDEWIFDPLMNTELKADIRVFSPLFLNFTKVYINTNLIGSSLFDEYIDKLYRVARNYVLNGKKEALAYFFFGDVLWAFDENLNKISYMDVSRVLSKGVALSASLMKSLETKPDKTDEIRYILFIASTNLRRWLKKYPRAFTHLGTPEISDLIFLMEKGGRLEIGSVIISLFHIGSEIVKLKETEHPLIYERIISNLKKIESKAMEILERNHWHIFVSNKELGVLNTEDNTIGAIQLANIVNENELEALKSFIQLHFTSVFLHR